MSRPSRWLWLMVLGLGCQASGRTPVSMVPPAPLDSRPRPTAEAAPRGTPSGMLSTALGTKKSGEEESSHPELSPPASPETPSLPKVEIPKVELPPAPVAPIASTPPPLPPLSAADSEPTKSPISIKPTSGPAPLPIEPAPPREVFDNPPAAPALAPPVPVEARPVSAAVRVESQPVVNNPKTNDVSDLRRLYDRARRQEAGMSSYTLRMRRREVVAGKPRPDELILARFRREPFSLYLKWIGEEGKNREVVYVAGQHDGLVHTLMAPGDLFLFAGKHFKVAPDSPLVKSNCRYPIAEAGMGSLVARFGRLVTAVESGQPQEGTAQYLGKVKRPEFAAPVEGVLQTLPTKYDALFPAGGQRHWYFDPETGLPTLVVAFDENRREVEYYFHDLIQSPGNLDDDDFNPHKLWKSN